MVNMLKKRLEGSHGKWAEELHGVLWAYRTTPKTATGETPYSLVYGSEAIVPTKMHVRTTVSRSTSQEDYNELMALSLDLLDEKREAARLRNWSYQQDVAWTYNKKVRTRTFQQGDWFYDEHKKQWGNSPQGGKDPIRSSRCGEQAPTGCKIAKVKYNPTAGTPCTSKPIIFNTVSGS
ncbi:hypothetical protein YC2023_010776 [Brassica napus]